MHGTRSTTSGPFTRKLQGFEPLQEADTALVTAIEAGERHFPGGTDLIREGDRPDGMIVITGGFACRYKLRETGARQITAYLLPGDVCDLDTSTLGRMDHTIGTLSSCRVVRLTSEASERLRERPDIARALRTAALVSDATLREWLVNLGRRMAVERLAHLFCELLMRIRAVVPTQGDSFDLPITQADLADTTGMTSVHVNRSLGELRRTGLIELKGKHLTIRDLPRLIEVAEFRPDYLHLGAHALTPELWSRSASAMVSRCA
ncbi:Transcriptional regulator, Crp/Fnr family [Methylorubrum populi]